MVGKLDAYQLNDRGMSAELIDMIISIDSIKCKGVEMYATYEGCPKHMQTVTT